MGVKEELYGAIIVGDDAAVKMLAQRAIDEGLQPAELLSKVFNLAMTEVGQRFERGEFFVPEMLLAARAMKAGVAVLRPLLTDSTARSAGTIVIGTVAGDLHDIGKNLVVLMMEGTGFKVIDLGLDVQPESFVQAVREHHPDIVGMSALLSTTMPYIQATVGALQKAGLRDQVMVMVGGAPVTQRFADEIGADLYAPDASSAARKAKEALGAV